MPPYDTAALVASIKRRAFLPTGQATFQTADILAAATEELQEPLAELLLSLDEDYWLAESDVALVAGQSAYRIPTRAMGLALRDIHLVQTDGSTQQLYRYAFESIAGRGSTSTGSPTGFYFKGLSHLVVWPTPTATQVSGAMKLRFTYRQRPSALVDSAGTRVAPITTAVISTGAVSVVAVPASMSVSTPLDLVRAKPGFDVLVASALPTNVGASTVTFGPGVLPSDTAVGDYLCFAEESPFPQVPPEAHSLLAVMTAQSLLESLGDSEGASIALAKLEKKAATLRNLLSDRVDGEPIALVSEDFC